MKIHVTHILAIISLAHAATYVWFWSDGLCVPIRNCLQPRESAETC